MRNMIARRSPDAGRPAASLAAWPPVSPQEPASPSGQAPPLPRPRSRPHAGERGPGGRVALVCTGRTVDGSPVWAPLDLAALDR